MTKEQWRAAWRIVNEARELPAAQRQLFIESESSDSEIVRHVLEMLDAPPDEELLAAAPPTHGGTRAPNRVYPEGVRSPDCGNRVIQPLRG